MRTHISCEYYETLQAFCFHYYRFYCRARVRLADAECALDSDTPHQQTSEHAPKLPLNTANRFYNPFVFCLLSTVRAHATFREPNISRSVCGFVSVARVQQVRNVLFSDV